MLKNRKGQGMVEYVLIIVLIVVIAIAGVKMFGGNVKNIFDKSATKIDTEAQSSFENE